MLPVPFTKEKVSAEEWLWLWNPCLLSVEVLRAKGSEQMTLHST